MTDQSNMQKMHNTPGHESNVQKMHIPQEWLHAAFNAYNFASPPGHYFSPDALEAALAAVIPLIEVRAADQERERLAKEAEEGIMVRAQISSEEFCAADAGHDVADWLRAQGRE